MKKAHDDRVYTKFQRHVDNAEEVISAKHINQVQEALGDTEQNVGKLKDYRFIDSVLFSFDSNLYVNSMFGDEVNNKKYIDFTLSTAIKHDEKERSIYVENKSLAGDVLTTRITSSIDEEVPLNDFFLVTDHYIPQGASIKYHLVTDMNETFPILPNEPKVPTTILNGTPSVRVKAILTKNSLGETPKLYGLALLFFDPAVEAQYGLINPDLRRFPSTEFGLTTLIRDRAQEDKLVEVLEPFSNVKLDYDWESNGELKKVISYSEKANMTVTDQLNYGKYLNSKGVEERVLLSVFTEETDNNIEDES